MKQEISKATLKALEKIAMQESAAIEGRGGLERKWNDTEDFPEVAVWSIEAMLVAASKLGKQAAKTDK